IAEDNPENRRDIAQILERAGHRPILVENGEKALKAMEDSRFDLVLMDLNMPEMSGLEAAKLYRFANIDRPHLPIIALTADATPQGQKLSREAGMDGCITKPIEAEALLRLVEKYAKAPLVAGKDGKIAPVVVANEPREGAKGDKEAAERAQMPVVDVAAIESLKSLGDDDMFFASLVEDFLADSEDVLIRIERAVAKDDARAVRDATHALRSSAAHFGARRLYQVLMSVSNITEADLMIRGRSFLRSLRAEYQLVRVELMRHSGVHRRAGAVHAKSS
ncbi:MAG: response regulator, partial [Alphaproteobacteria bacterium]